MHSSCPSCCTPCLSGALSRPATISSVANPYALVNLLPAGTVRVRISLPHDLCSHTHAEDGWHPFGGQSLVPHLTNSEDDSFVQQLDFLVKHLFVSATCQLTGPRTTLHIRIYVIPYDLANVQGQLRVRDEVRVVAPARRYMKVLLPKILQSRLHWEGIESEDMNSHPFLPQSIDNRTMAEIYGDLHSPPAVACGDIWGMKCGLHNYQRHSVAAMVQKETSPTTIADPLFIPVIGLNGQEFYLQPARMEILRERPSITQNRGGILCEELGTGKTVMILALVLATLDQLPAPEESLLDSRPVLTPLAFRHFPSGDFATARARTLHRRSSISFSKHPRVPSLTELLLHKIRQTSNLDDYEEYLQTKLYKTLLWKPLIANYPFYLHFNIDFPETGRVKRKQLNLGPRVMYLTTATLIIVPGHLVSQWRSEILKHCEDGALRDITITGKENTPTAQLLASQYDVVLMSHKRFASEEASKNITKLHSIICTCPEFGPEFGHSRVPECNCESHPEVSPLFQIRWKRIVIDEGHNSANIDSRMTSLAKSLSVERRWIVTGTPTTNLLGLSFGKSSEAPVQGSDLDALQLDSGSQSTDTSEAGDCGDSLVTRKWTSSDREDLRKLSAMMIHFLSVPHFSVQPQVFDTHIIDPLFNPGGPQPGSIRVLTQVMQTQMIRHRIEDVEAEVVLPQITQEEVLLDLDPYAVKSYNAFQAGIAINAIDSERKDQDYLFHPRNVKSLLIAVANMSQLMFWSVSDTCYNVDQLFRDYEDHRKTAINRRVSNDDLALLEQCRIHIQAAAEDPIWRSMQTHEFVPYLVFNLPSEQVFNAWRRENNPVEISSGCITGFMHPDRLVSMRDMVVRHPLMSEGRMVRWARKVQDSAPKIRAKKTASSGPLKKSKSSNAIITEDIRGKNSGKNKALSWAHKVTSPSKVKEMQQELRAALEKQRMLDEDEGVDGDNVRSGHSRVNPAMKMGGSVKAALLASSPLARVRVRSSTSTKLNYILNEVLTYASEEKFLIFSQHPLSLAHVADGLDLIQVKYLEITSHINASLREDSVRTFETSDTYRVLLMDLKHGARGLNLITASRVIFCEPVWQADVESQAIKRAHRIGQTRSVTVKTLAIRSTAEETMLARRNALKESVGKLPSLEKEAGMRHFIENPKFLDNRPTQLPTFEVPLIDVDGMVGSDTDEPIAVTFSQKTGGDDTHPDEPPRKKSRVVRFSSDEDARMVGSGSLLGTPLLQGEELGLGETIDRERSLRMRDQRTAVRFDEPHSHSAGVASSSSTTSVIPPPRLKPMGSILNGSTREWPIMVGSSSWPNAPSASGESAWSGNSAKRQASSQQQIQRRTIRFADNEPSDLSTGGASSSSSSTPALVSAPRVTPTDGNPHEYTPKIRRKGVSFADVDSSM